jgi:hypothetical protein
MTTLDLPRTPAGEERRHPQGAQPALTNLSRRPASWLGCSSGLQCPLSAIVSPWMRSSPLPPRPGAPQCGRRSKRSTAPGDPSPAAPAALARHESKSARCSGSCAPWTTAPRLEPRRSKWPRASGQRGTRASTRTRSVRPHRVRPESNRAARARGQDCARALRGSLVGRGRRREASPPMPGRSSPTGSAMDADFHAARQSAPAPSVFRPSALDGAADGGSRSQRAPAAAARA